MFEKRKKLKDDMVYCRLERMLREMAERGYNLNTTDSPVGIVCDDGIILLSFEDKGWRACMVRNYLTLPDFSLRLTAEQMQEYNGGKGIKARSYKYRKNSEFRE